MKTKIQIVNIPFDDKSSFMKGPALGPDKIMETFHDGSANSFAENGIDLANDVELIETGNLQISTYEDIEEQLKELIQANDKSTKYICLGGDHSVSYPIVKVMSNHHTSFDLLHFDAHADLYDEYEGDKYSHACPFARIMELGVVNRLVQVGIRTLTNHQRAQAEKFGVEIIDMQNLHLLHDLKFSDKLYISIDLDGFDPAFAPGVSHHEPGGLNPREVINFLHKLNCNIIGADIVELNPLRDASNITAALGAKLLRELCGIMA